MEIVRGKGNVTAYVTDQGQRFKRYYGYYATEGIVRRDFLTRIIDFEFERVELLKNVSEKT